MQASQTPKEALLEIKLAQAKRALELASQALQGQASDAAPSISETLRLLNQDGGQPVEQRINVRTQRTTSTYAVITTERGGVMEVLLDEKKTPEQSLRAYAAELTTNLHHALRRLQKVTAAADLLAAKPGAADKLTAPTHNANSNTGTAAADGPLHAHYVCGINRDGEDETVIMLSSHDATQYEETGSPGHLVAAVLEEGCIEHARRLAACWNVCQGVPTDTLVEQCQDLRELVHTSCAPQEPLRQRG